MFRLSSSTQLGDLTVRAMLRFFSFSFIIILSTFYIQGFSGDGFLSLAVLYATFAVVNWLAPAFVEFIGNIKMFKM